MLNNSVSQFVCCNYQYAINLAKVSSFKLVRRFGIFSKRVIKFDMRAGRNNIWKFKNEKKAKKVYSELVHNFSERIT